MDDLEKFQDQIIKWIESKLHPCILDVLLENNFPETVKTANGMTASIESPQLQDAKRGELCRYIFLRNFNTNEPVEFCTINHYKNSYSILLQYKEIVVINGEKRIIGAANEIGFFELERYKNRVIEESIQMLQKQTELYLQNELKNSAQ